MVADYLMDYFPVIFLNSNYFFLKEVESAQALKWVTFYMKPNALHLSSLWFYVVWLIAYLLRSLNQWSLKGKLSNIELRYVKKITWKKKSWVYFRNQQSKIHLSPTIIDH